MAKMKTQQIDVTDLTAFIRRSGRITRPVEVTLQGEIVGRMVPPGAEPTGTVPPASERAKAWREIEKIQRKVGRMMKRTGKTEEEFDRIVQGARDE